MPPLLNKEISSRKTTSFLHKKVNFLRKISKRNFIDKFINEIFDFIDKISREKVARKVAVKFLG